jgi:phosphoserine phosphatase RsbX
MGMMKFSVSYEQRNCRNETVCGDAVAVETDESTGITHVAVIDGLGHGPAAHLAAEAFVSYFREKITPDLSLVDLLQGASSAIARTRGVAASVLRLDGTNREIQYAGVGNVEMTAVSVAPIRPISKAGIIGRRLGRLLHFDYPLHHGDLLTVFTDGISSRFNLEPLRDMDPQALCRQVLSEWGKAHDDATIVAIRCL